MEFPIRVENELYQWAIELRRPSTLYRPSLFIDGTKWCALYGDNIQDGVAGFGDSPEEAYSDFDVNWGKKLCQSQSTKAIKGGK